MAAITVSRHLDETLTANGPFYLYYRGRYDPNFSMQVRMTTGVGAGNDELKLTAEMCNHPYKKTQIEAMSAGDLDDAFSPASLELFGDSDGIDNTGGAVDVPVFADTKMVAYWWRFRYERTAKANDNGRIRLNIFEPHAVG